VTESLIGGLTPEERRKFLAMAVRELISEEPTPGPRVVERAATKRAKKTKGDKVEVAVRTDWTREKHICPKCDHHGPVDPDFGIRVVRGVERKQSYCGKCRATLNYHDKPRKNVRRG
jgi:hypothetical protein